MPARKLEDTKSYGSLSSLELRNWDLWGSISDVEMSNDSVSVKRKSSEHRSRQSHRSPG